MLRLEASAGDLFAAKVLRPPPLIVQTLDGSSQFGVAPIRHLPAHFRRMIKKAVQAFFNRKGFQVIRVSLGYAPEEMATMDRVRGYTSTSTARIAGLIQAVKYLVSNRIPGDFVECGVWRGGSMMAAALTLLNLGDRARHLHLFDTFEGMSEPTEKDVMFDGRKASDILRNTPKKEGPDNYWCWASLEDVQRNMESTGYPMDKVHLVQGKVEETIPKQAPPSIALLRLDTDWYASTRHELEHLYPRLAPHGVLIIDDYGHWEGARQAVDEYFTSQPFKPLLSHLDYTGRLAIKSA